MIDGVYMRRKYDLFCSISPKRGGGGLLEFG